MRRPRKPGPRVRHGEELDIELVTLADLLAQEPTRASVTGLPLPKARPAAPLGTATLRVGSGERPTGDCTPASRWVKADRLHPLVPRESARWRKLYGRRA
jgi:hypothetical protein